MADHSLTAQGERALIGLGQPQSDAKAFALFTAAAANGDSFAENELGYLYAAGRGTKRDDSKAFYWYNQAANHGLVTAQYNVGLMYQYGLGTKVDSAMAKVYFTKAASAHFEPAEAALNAL